MALFIPGMLCPICKKPISAASEIAMFPPFVANRLDELFVFSDAVVHVDCLARHPLAAQALKLRDEAKRSSEPRNLVCAACGELIADPDDYFGTGLLTSDPRNSLYEFNFVHLHRHHARQWMRFDEFRRRMEAFQTSDAWQGPRVVFGDAAEDAVRWKTS